MMAKEELVFLPLGGSGEIGMNMNLYGYGPPAKRQWIMIDCGVMFGDLTTPGIDAICADPEYILSEKQSLNGLLLTHGHEDHIGAVAHLATRFDCPVFATPFTAALVTRKLMEANIDIDLQVIDLESRFTLGPFDIQYVNLTHSIPEPCGLILRTPAGVVLHTGDWKIDKTPTLGPTTDSKTLSAIGDDGVLAMICDSTNVLSPGESGSEKGVRDNLTRVIGECEGRVAVTTFASNLSRVLAICDAAAANDRSVCLLGRSMLRIMEAAREVGLAPKNLTFVEPREAGFLPREHILYLCTGSQGEPRAALARIARGDHRDIALTDGDTVIFSSKIIPGNERGIFDLQNDLVDLGVEVITEKDEDIHVSGHPCRDELKMMYEWVRPHYAIPVHGEARHLETHADLAVSLGSADALAPRNGDLIRIAPGTLEVIDEVPSGRLHLDGDILLPDGASPVRERRKLGFAGVVAVSVSFDRSGRRVGDVLVDGKGIHPDGEHIDQLAEEISDAIDDLASKKRMDDEAVEICVKRAARGFFDEHWGKRPLIMTLIQR